MHMTLFHTYPAKGFGSRGPRSGSRFPAARATRKIVAALQTMHRAIIAAKLRRLRNELMLHGRGQTLPELDTARIPQRPLLLDDKWDF